MQARTLPARRGWAWIVDGFAIWKRNPALITFLAAAANITLLGIGGAFWGLVVGLAAHAVLHGHLPRPALANKDAVS